MRSDHPDSHVPGGSRESASGTSDGSATTLSLMSEDAWFELISASVDGELSSPERELVERELERSPRARDLHHDLAAMRRRTLVQPVDPMPDLTDQIVAIAGSATAVPGDPSRRSERRRWLPWASVAAAAAAVVMIAGLVVARPWTSPTGTSSSESATITASDSSFDNTDVHVNTGSAITWVNAGGTTHELVQELPDASVSGVLRPDEDRSVTFDEPGVYQFYCGIHDNMSGTVTVGK